MPFALKYDLQKSGDHLSTCVRKAGSTGHQRQDNLTISLKINLSIASKIEMRKTVLAIGRSIAVHCKDNKLAGVVPNNLLDVAEILQRRRDIGISEL